MRDTFKRLNWPNIIIAISLIAIGIGIYFVFRKSPDEEPKQQIGTSQRQQAQENNDRQRQDDQRPSTPSTPAPSTPKPATTPAPNLVNSGPGETIALFSVVTAAGAVMHQVTLRRRILQSK